MSTHLQASAVPVLPKLVQDLNGVCEAMPHHLPLHLHLLQLRQQLAHAVLQAGQVGQGAQRGALQGRIGAARRREAVGRHAAGPLQAVQHLRGAAVGFWALPLCGQSSSKARATRTGGPQRAAFSDTCPWERTRTASACCTRPSSSNPASSPSNTIAARLEGQ